ncbi:MAG TPA: hypothetical protein VFZ61_08460, partial [Polyangiales bacterium]
PLEVARHALAFLATMEGRSHTEETAEVRSHLERAARDLAILLFEDVPLGAEPRVDDRRPEVVDGARIYVLPGGHNLALWLGDQRLESLDIQLRAGVVQPWPRVRESQEAEAEQAPPLAVAAAPETSSAPALSRTPSSSGHATMLRPARPALVLGISGALIALGAVGTYGYTLHRAEVLEDWPPSREGYTDASYRYRNAGIATATLALTGGVVMASGAALARAPKRGGLAISLTFLALGLASGALGAVLLAHTAPALVPDTAVETPARVSGSLLVGAALPLLSYGVRLQWSLWGHH